MKHKIEEYRQAFTEKYHIDPLETIKLMRKFAEVINEVANQHNRFVQTKKEDCIIMKEFLKTEHEKLETIFKEFKAVGLNTATCVNDLIPLK